MKVFLNSRSGNYNAKGEYDIETKKLIVLVGSKISGRISDGKFRSAKSIEKQRKSCCVKDGIVIQDIEFKSPSSAANFITGSSTNGMVAWKDENGVPLKKLS